MTDATITRRGFLGAVAGAGARALVATGGGLVIAGALPGHAGAVAGGHGGGCQAPWGPLHNYLWQTAPDFWWQHAVLWRESNFVASAYNSTSGASGIAQFMPEIWDWLVSIDYAAGSPYDPYAAIAAMNTCVREGWYWMWDATG